MSRSAVFVVAALAALAGCHAPPVQIDEEDAGIDAHADDTLATDADADARLDAPEEVHDAVHAPDGRVCRGHDEDLDGVPDECDDCPGVADGEQRIGTGEIGTVCWATPGSAFERASRRLFFESFETPPGGWIDFSGGIGKFGIEDDTLGGGTSSDDSFRFLVARRGAASRVTVVTTVFDTLGGFEIPATGILLRATTEPVRFVFCAIGPTGAPSGTTHLELVVYASPSAGCDGTACALERLASRALPPEVTVDAPLGLRAAISSGAGGATAGSLECRYWNPADKATLSTADARYFVTVPLTAAQFIASGDVGLGVFRERAAFHWIDVLVEPTISP